MPNRTTFSRFDLKIFHNFEKCLFSVNFKYLPLKLQIWPYLAKWAKFRPNFWPNKATFP